MGPLALFANLGVGFSIAVLPFVVGRWFAAAELPPFLAYLVFPGRHWLVILGGLVVAAAVDDRFGTDRLSERFAAVARHRRFGLALLALVSFVAFARVPQPEKEAEAFGGDEPKYLRIAYSLLRDLDADVGSGRTVTPDLSVRLQQVQHLVLEARDAAVELLHPVEAPPGHVWNAGNWSVNGRHGGIYHLQPPGLPALVAVALGFGEILLPERDPGISVAALLSLIWILAAREMWMLFKDFTKDPLLATVFAGIVFSSAPVFVGGYQLFPESLALWVFPWLLRRLRASERGLGIVGGLACGLVAGYLLWVHPKLTFVALFFGALALARPRTRPMVKIAFGLGFVLMVFTALLYCHHISGLFRPEGLYIRQAEEYVASPNPFSLRFAAGLVKALIGGRDGLLLFAPILALGFMTPGFVRWPSRISLELGGLFLVVWLTSAVHDGASLGSPARLMAPVAFVPAFFLLRSLRNPRARQIHLSGLFLFLVGCTITFDMTTDWRKNVNPYRSMFTDPATNFEPGLPGNSFSEEAYVLDLVKGGFILLTLGFVAGALRRDQDRATHSSPARFGLGAFATIVVLAFGLQALGIPP